jgi:hypothetical protein
MQQDCSRSKNQQIGQPTFLKTKRKDNEEAISVNGCGFAALGVVGTASGNNGEKERADRLYQTERPSYSC